MLRYFSYFSLKGYLVFLFAFFFSFTVNHSLLEQRKTLKARVPDSLKRLRAFPRVPVSGEQVLELYQDRFLLQFYYIFTKKGNNPVPSDGEVKPSYRVVYMNQDVSVKKSLFLILFVGSEMFVLEGI